MADKVKFIAGAFNTGEFNNDGSADFVLNNVASYYDKVVEIETAPKMIGSGSYIISKRVAERDVTLTLHSFKTQLQSQTIAKQLNAAATSFQTVTLEYTPNGGSKETLTGLITSVTSELNNVNTVFEITVKIIGG